MCEGHKYLETKKEGRIPSKPQGKSLSAFSSHSRPMDEMPIADLAVALFEQPTPPAKALPEDNKAADPVQSLTSEVSVAAKAAVDAENPVAKVNAKDSMVEIHALISTEAEMLANVRNLLLNANRLEPGYVGKNIKEERRKWQEEVTISLAQSLGIKLVKFNMEDKSSRIKTLKAVRHAILTRCGKESERNMPEFLRNPA